MQQAPVSLTLKLGTYEANYTSLATDANGLFTLDTGPMPYGTYQWRVKGPKFLANIGSVTLTGNAVTVEMGTLIAGDANNDNIINVADFTVVKSTFGKGVGQPGYDDRADFTGDSIVNVADFGLLKANFGQGGSPPLGPSNVK
jgi:hypothetical protein